LKIDRNRYVSELNRICAACTNEPYLGSIIESTGTAAECDYCGKAVLTIVLEELVDRCEHVIEAFYGVTSMEDSVLYCSSADNSAPLRQRFCFARQTLLGRHKPLQEFLGASCLVEQSSAL
jgi:hypothetical protein